MKKFVLLCLFSGAAFAAIPQKPLTIGIAQEIETLNPMTIHAQATVYQMYLAIRALVRENQDGKWEPQLAERIPSFKNGDAKFITVNGKKTLQAIWRIREKARWSDGKPVTCEDFQLAREVAASPNVSVQSRDTFTIVEKIEWMAMEPKKCTFTYTRPRWDFYRISGFFPLPAHLERPIFQKYGAEKEGYERNSLYVQQPTAKGLYNGPYQVSEIKLGSHISVVPNPYFYNEPPKIPQIMIKLVPDTGTLVSNLRSKTIDSISSMGLTLDQALEFEKTVQSEKLPFLVEYRPSTAYEQIAFNFDNPKLQDPKIRKALVHAVNRQELVHSFYAGKQIAANHFLHPSDPWAPAKLSNAIPYDARKSAQLFDEAGWKLNSKDGYRYKNGEKLSFQFMTTSGNKNRETVQAYLQNSWKKVGVEIIIKNEPARLLFGETMPKRKFTGLVMFANSATGDLRPSFHSSEISSEKNGWAGANTSGWRNPQVDQLIEKIEVEFNEKAQAALAAKVIQHYLEDAPALPLFFRANNAVNPVNLKNFKLAIYPDETTSAEHWEWR